MGFFSCKVRLFSLHVCVNRPRQRGQTSRRRGRVVVIHHQAWHPAVAALPPLSQIRSASAAGRSSHPATSDAARQGSSSRRKAATPSPGTRQCLHLGRVTVPPPQLGEPGHYTAALPAASLLSTTLPSTGDKAPPLKPPLKPSAVVSLAASPRLFSLSRSAVDHSSAATLN